MEKYKRLILSILPAVGTTPFLTGTPDPGNAREIAGFYQSLAIVTDPIVSYTYLTPAESMASLHLHSILSLPFFVAGSDVAGRILSLISIIIAAMILSELGARYISQTAGLLAPGLLWAHPLSMVFAISWWPEALSIALTTGAVYASLRYLDSTSRRWWWMLVGLVGLAPLNHLWEASIALPLCLVLLHERDYKAALGVAAATAGSLAAITAVKSLQPTAHDLVADYSILTNPDALFSTPWILFKEPAAIDTFFDTGMAVLVPGALFAIAYFTCVFYRDRDRLSLLMKSWLLSGLLILIVLPEGWTIHKYYPWGLLAPGALSAAWMGHSLLDSLPQVRAPQTGRVAAAVLILLASVAITIPAPASHAGGQYELSNSELERAAHAIDKRGVNRADRIVFVGDWHDELRWGGFYEAPMITDVLVRSRTRVYARGLDNEGAPAVVNSSAAVSDCSLMIIRQNDTVIPRSC